MRGRQPSRGAPTYDFAKFCEKLHEIEKILGHGGGGAHRGHPPKSTTASEGPDIIMHQLKSIYISSFKDLHSDPIHSCFPMIASNVFPKKWKGTLKIVFRHVLPSTWPATQNIYNSNCNKVVENPPENSTWHFFGNLHLKTKQMRKSYSIKVPNRK